MTMIEMTTEIAVDAIRVGERARLDLGDIGELAESIRTMGLLQPVLVRRSGDAYELVAGGRRLEAVRSLGWMLVPATVRDMTDALALLAEAVENGHRKQFAPSEAATLGMQLEERAKAGDLDVLGNLPTDDRLSARIARVFGWSDRTYRKARDIVAYEPDTVTGGELATRIETEMDSTGKVDGPHRAIRALAVIEEHARHDDAEVREMATAILASAADAPGFDLEAEATGLVSFAEQIPAGDDVADPTGTPVDEHDVAHGGSDVSPPEASEPAPAWRNLSAAQREAMAHLWRESSLRYSNKTTETTIYHVVAERLLELGLVSITVPPGGTFDSRVVELTDLGADVMVLDTLDEAEDFLEASGFETPTRAGGDDDADGKGSAGPSEMATEHDDSAAPSADDEGESASELPATTGGARPEGWPPRAESHPSLTGMTEAGFKSSAPFYAAARVLMDSILEGDTPEEAVDRYQSGPQSLTDDQLDYVLAHFDVPAPAPGPVSGSEPPAPSAGVNGSHAPEGDELAPDPSTDVEGEEFGTVPATVPAADEEPEIRRSGSSSTTHLPHRKEPASRPVLTTETLTLLEALEAAAREIELVPPAEVDRALGAHSQGGALGARFVAAIDMLEDRLPGVRFVARPV